jgi:hypothetical protein
MSGHTDIRCTHHGAITERVLACPYCQDEFVAENQRLRAALEEIDHYSHMGDGAWDAYLHVKQIAARAILAGTPSEDTE